MSGVRRLREMARRVRPLTTENVMGTRMTVAILATVLASAASNIPGQSAFSGTWTLDPSKGVLHDARPRDITLSLADDGQTVTVTERMPGRTDNRYSCSSDGKVCEQKKSGSVYRRILKRESGALVWQNSMTRVGDNASISWTERWSLADGGRTLNVHKQYPGHEFLEVYKRPGS